MGAAAGLALFARRCARHPSPVVDPAMLRVRSFAMANVAAILFSAAFGAMLLSNVLFMTGVWQESILRAGLQLAPGPALAAITAVASSRLTNQVGQRRLAGLGCSLFALGIATVALRAGTVPDYAGDLLPGLILTGVGVGLVLPSLNSAAAASLPPARFATGAAVLTMSRQLGIALGVALLVAVLGTPAPAEVLGAFQAGWDVPDRGRPARRGRGPGHRPGRTGPQPGAGRAARNRCRYAAGLIPMRARKWRR